MPELFHLYNWSAIITGVTALMLLEGTLEKKETAIAIYIIIATLFQVLTIGENNIRLYYYYTIYELFVLGTYLWYCSKLNKKYLLAFYIVSAVLIYFFRTDTELTKAECPLLLSLSIIVMFGVVRTSPNSFWNLEFLFALAIAVYSLNGIMYGYHVISILVFWLLGIISNSITTAGIIIHLWNKHSLRRLSYSL